MKSVEKNMSIEKYKFYYLYWIYTNTNWCA